MMNKISTLWLLAASLFFRVIEASPVRLRRAVYNADDRAAEEEPPRVVLEAFRFLEDEDATFRLLQMSMSFSVNIPDECEGVGPEQFASFPLYATGDIGCNGAEETDNRVGTGYICSKGTEVYYEAQLEGVAEDWEYYIELQTQEGGCLDVLSQIDGFTTDDNGDGVFSGTFEAPVVGAYDLNIDVVSAQEVPPDPRNREIGGEGYAQIIVEEA